MKKRLIGRMVVTVMVALTLLITATGCSSEPTTDFLNLPLCVVYSNNGVEGTFGDKVTVNDLITHGFKVEIEKSWKKFDDSTWSFIAKATDKVTGKSNQLDIVLVRQTNPDRVIFHRLLIDGQEANGYEKDTMANQLAYNASDGK